MTYSCLECAEHMIIADPDPYDTFCSDDVAIVCKIAQNPDKDDKSVYAADHSEFRPVTVSCRPHYARKEATRPKWCPKINQKGDEK